MAFGSHIFWNEITFGVWAICTDRLFFEFAKIDASLIPLLKKKETLLSRVNRDEC